MFTNSQSKSNSAIVQNTQGISPGHLQALLIEGLDIIPSNWALTPVGGKKAPYRTKWQHETPLSKGAIAAEIKSGIAKGYGLRTGVVSGGIVAIDADGHAAHDEILKLSGGEQLPKTVAFTSNKPGRCQYLFSVPQEYWGAITTKKISTGVKGDDGKEQQLELRWDGCQSVLPPSVHPETGNYRWRKSPEEVAIAECPMWIIEQMIADNGEAPHQLSFTPSITENVPLYQCLTIADRQLINIGTTPGTRNDLGAKLARNLIGTAQRLNYLCIRFDGDPRQLFDDYCHRCNPPLAAREGEVIWKSAQKDNPTASLTDDALENCAKAWLRNQKKLANSYQQKTTVTHENKSSVTGDSRSGGDSQGKGTMSIAATVTTVTEILKTGFQDWDETNKLEALRVQSELSHKPAFYALVNGIKSQIDEVQLEDEIRLQSLIDWHNAELDFHQALPSMAEDILHDAKVLNIDPIGIWQYLLPAVLSLAGKRVNLDIESHEIPAIAWTAILAESGTGKTRAEKLITSPLKQLQKQARDRFNADLEEWEETTANWEKGNGKKPPKPVERKYLFDVATIQAVMRRQSEQGMNGSLWARDELVGVFQSFGQFNKGENEALTCLLASWDGGNSQVDRVNQEDSYLIESSRLSIAGGLQPGIFKKAFKDPNDAQGLQARFLFAAMKPKKPKRVKGFCSLSEKLPTMYQWLDTLHEGKIKLSREADKLYDKLYEAIGEQAFNTSMPAIRAWMFKLPAQLLRIALGLHLIECYYDRDRPLWMLQKDTLERAVLFAQYYRSVFHIVQTTAADTDDISAILLQIWDKAATRHPEGISTRDAYREIKAIQFRAKDAGRPISAYTADLFSKLEQMGKGSVIKNGRQIKFVANLNPPPISPISDGKVSPEGTPPSDRVTVDSNPLISMDTTVTKNQLSPVTVQTSGSVITNEKYNDESVSHKVMPDGEVVHRTDVSDVDDLKNQYGYNSPEEALQDEQEPVQQAAPISPLEELEQKLSNCSFSGEFQAAIAGFLPEEIEQAIAAQSQELQLQLRSWLEPVEEQPTPVEQTASTSADEIGADEAIASSTALCAIAPPPAATVTEVQPVADYTPEAAPLPQKPSIEVAEVTPHSGASKKEEVIEPVVESQKERYPELRQNYKVGDRVKAYFTNSITKDLEGVVTAVLPDEVHVTSNASNDGRELKTVIKHPDLIELA